MEKKKPKQKLKIGFFGDGLWASRAVSKIVEHNEFEIVFITPRFEFQDDSLRSWAIRLGIPFVPSSNVNDISFISEVQRYEADIFVSMSFDQILGPTIINSPDFGFINCHAGALPFYRGRNPLNWALINGESHFGVTVHRVDTGIDTGAIIVQNFSEIKPEDNYSTLLKRAHHLCAESLVESLRRIHDGSATYTEQVEVSDKFTYFSRRRVGDEWINWSWPSERIHNLVRGITLPAPCARTFNGVSPLAVVSSQLVADVPPYIGSDGEVIVRDSDGVIVKTGSGAIRITETAPIISDGQLDALVVPKFPIGTRLGINMYDEFVALRRRVSELEFQFLKRE